MLGPAPVTPVPPHLLVDTLPPHRVFCGISVERGGGRWPRRTRTRRCAANQIPALRFRALLNEEAREVEMPPVWTGDKGLVLPRVARAPFAPYSPGHYHGAVTGATSWSGYAAPPEQEQP